jgi:hypothetical protein
MFQINTQSGTINLNQLNQRWYTDRGEPALEFSGHQSSGREMEFAPQQETGPRRQNRTSCA